MEPREYAITVTNLDTNEVALLTFETFLPVQAQERALLEMFRRSGWRRSTARYEEDMDA
jgi:hypothetical protein